MALFQRLSALWAKTSSRMEPGEGTFPSPGSRYFLLPILAIFVLEYQGIGNFSEHLYRISTDFLLDHGMDSALAWFYSSFFPGTLLANLVRGLLVLWGLHLYRMKPDEIGWKRPKSWLLSISAGIGGGIFQYAGSELIAKMSRIIFYQRLPYVKFQWDSAWTQLSNPTAINRVLNSWNFTPVFEELLYRGLVYAVLKKRLGRTWAILISSFLFALRHFVYHGNRPLTSANFLMLMSAGIAFALLREWDGTLLAPIAAHATNLFMYYAMDISFRMF